MPVVSKKENVTITYSSGTIVIKGQTIDIVGAISSSELMSIYWGSKGKGSVRVSMDIPELEPVKVDEKRKVILKDHVAELAKAGQSEDEIMNGYIFVD